MNREELNARLKRITVRGAGQYVTVPQRVQGFWEACPEGAITIEWLIMERDWCMCRATVSVMGVVVAQGTAMEERTEKGVNSTSFYENCETSAVGRAIGFFGIGSVESIASADEVMRAVERQEQAEAERAAQQQVKGQQKAIGEARTRALAAGVTDEQMYKALQAEIPNKKSSVYTAAEAARAIAIIEGLIKEVQNGA